MAAAIRHRGIFHYCLHPENLTESRYGFSMFEEMLDRLIRTRDRGDIEILTMGEVAARMERGKEREPDSAPGVLSGSATGVSTGGREHDCNPARTAGERVDGAGRLVSQFSDRAGDKGRIERTYL
jgi:hypothetical protein